MRFSLFNTFIPLVSLSPLLNKLRFQIQSWFGVLFDSEAQLSTGMHCDYIFLLLIFPEDFLFCFCFLSYFFIGLISLYCPLFTDSNNFSTQFSQICLHQFISPWRHPPWTPSFSYSLCWALLDFKAAVILVLSFLVYVGYSCLSPQRHFLFSGSHVPRASQSLSF